MQALFTNPDSYAYSPFAIPMAAVGLFSLGVGLWVVIREHGRPISYLFLSVAAAVAVYLLGFSFMVSSADPGLAELWARVAYLGVPLIVPALYHFSMGLLGLTGRRRHLIMAGWVIGFLYAILALTTDWLIVGVIDRSWGYFTDLSPWNTPFVLWSIALTALGLGDYLVAYFDAGPVQRARIRWLAIPILVGSTAFIDYLPSLGFDTEPWGFVGIVGFIGASAWVVARYHFPHLTPAATADRILATMAEPLLVVNELDKVAFTNAAATRLLEWNQNEMEGERLDMLLGEATARTLLDPRGLRNHEMEMLARTGHAVPVSVSTSRILIGDRTRGTVIVARDIRERRRAAQALEEREQYYRALIENARDTISVVDRHGTTLYKSPSHALVLGCAPDIGIGENAFERAHPDDRDRLRRLFKELLGEPNGIRRATARIQHSDGGYRVMDLMAQNLLGHPAVQGIVINGRDITEEQELTQELQQARKLEAIGRLAGGIAHDFNNVLTAIQGNVEVLDETAHDRDAEGAVQAIRTGAERAARLTHQLLSFSRQQLTRPVRLELNGALRDLGPRLQQLVSSHSQARLRLELTEDSHVHVDAGQLEQCVIELVRNAAEAAIEGEVVLSVANVELGDDTLLPLEPGGYVRLAVEDAGPGMDEETRERLFEPFYTTKREGTGSGLGLATAYGAVRQASGHIEVKSAPGDGTTVVVYLPRQDAPADRDPGPAHAPEAAGAAAATDVEAAPGRSDGPGAEKSARTPVILVVEDEAPVRSLITRVLERAGYHVLDAADGNAAVATARAFDGTIDLLIADLVMPGLTGREVAEQLALQYPQMAIILISGYTADEVVREGISRGEYTFVPKPFTPTELKDEVARTLEARTVG